MISPAVEALVAMVEGLTGPVSAEDYVRLQELALAVRSEDPLASAFKRARDSFRKERR